MKLNFAAGWIAVLLLAVLPAIAQATFSIAAVDPETGQVGSAGASCISGSIILSDVHPGAGVVHTQAYWNAQNQQYARLLMDSGYAPQAIVDSVVTHDAQGNPTIRQYGVVDLVDGGRSAGYTGVNCTNYKGHLLGPTYAIQGNILLGPEILEGMEEAFLSTDGTLADRLMAALQAAKVPGADTRCLPYGKSAISAFLRVARTTDAPGSLYLDLNVNNTGSGETDPIDVLQGLYDEWEAAGVPDDGGADAVPGAAAALRLSSRPNPFERAAVIVYELPAPMRVVLAIFDPAGRRLETLVDAVQTAGPHQVVWAGPSGSGGGVPGAIGGCGMYFCRLEAGSEVRTTKLLRLAR